MHIIIFPLYILLSVLEPRSILKVKCLSQGFMSVASLTLFKGFSCYLLRWLAHLRDTSQPFWLKVKFTLEGQVFESAFHVNFIFPTFFERLMKFGSNDKFTETMCAWGISQTFKYKVKVMKGKCLNLHFLSASYLSHFVSIFMNLAQKFSSLRQCSKGISQPLWLKVKVTLFKKLEAFLSYLVTIILALGRLRTWT